MNSISFMYIPPTEIEAVWDIIKKGVNICIRKGGLGIHTEELVFKSLTSGGWALWVMHLRKRIVGFYILNIVIHSHIEIVYGYVGYKGFTSKIKTESLAKIEDIARAFRCSKILAYSTRTGMNQVLSEKAGYTKEMVIYCKDLMPHETPKEDMRN